MAPKQTAWAGSSLPSDRIQPRKKPQNLSKPKGKDSDQAEKPPKSRAVRGLEETIKKLETQSAPPKNPDGGCFCQARTHELSTYMPMCMNCGLILCSINQPYFCCPHCLSAILDDTSKPTLLTQLNAELTNTIAKEDAEIERLEEEARQKAGSFPSLAKQSAPAKVQAQAHKVLSLNAKTKKVMVTSYNQAPSHSASAAGKGSVLALNEPPEEDVHCVPFVQKCIPENSSDDAARPWADASRGERDVLYVRDALIDREEVGRARKERKEEARAQVAAGTAGGV